MVLPQKTVPGRAERWLVAGLGLATTLAPLNSSMIAVALPSIRSDLHIGAGQVTWLVTGYLILMASLQPTLGRLGDLAGRRRMLLSGLLLFILASIGAGLAGSFAWLLCFRLLQAGAGALALPSGAALVRMAIPQLRRGRAFGLISSFTSLAAAAGPPLAGILIWFAGWQTIFWVNLFVLLPACLLIWRFVPPDPPVEAKPSVAFDFAGAISLCLLLFAAASWLSGTIGRGSFGPEEGVAIALLMALFVFYESRHHAPVLKPGLFLNRGFAGAAGCIALTNFTMYMPLLAVPLLLSARAGFAPTAIGWILAVMSGATFFCAPWGGVLADKHGRRTPVLFGCAALIGGAGVLAVNGASIGVPLLALALVLIGAGVGLASAGLQTVAVEAAAPAESGLAMGMYATSRYVGSIVGSALLARLLQSLGAAAYGALFNAVLVTAALSMVVALALPGLPRMRAPLGTAPSHHTSH